MKLKSSKIQTPLCNLFWHDVSSISRRIIFRNEFARVLGLMGDFKFERPRRRLKQNDASRQNGIRPFFLSTNYAASTMTPKADVRNIEDPLAWRATDSRVLGFYYYSRWKDRFVFRDFWSELNHKVMDTRFFNYSPLIFYPALRKLVASNETRLFQISRLLTGGSSHHKNRNLIIRK